MWKRLSVISIAGSVVLFASNTEAGRSERKLNAKIGTYVDTINEVTSQVIRERDSYAKWVADYRTGPNCKERGRGMAQGPGYTRDMVAKLRKAIKAKPHVKQLDEAATRLADAMDLLRKTTTDRWNATRRRPTEQLTAQQQCDLDKKFHPRIVESLEKYLAADREVRAWVNKRNDDRAAAALKKTKKKYGPLLRYHHSKLMIDAKAMLARLRAELAQAKPDGKKLVEATLEFVQTRAALAKLLESKKMKRSGSDSPGYMEWFAASGRFADYVDKMLQAYDGRKPLSKGELRRIERGHAIKRTTLQSPIDGYNSMVKASNRIRFAKTTK